MFEMNRNAKGALKEISTKLGLVSCSVAYSSINMKPQMVTQITNVVQITNVHDMSHLSNWKPLLCRLQPSDTYCCLRFICKKIKLLCATVGTSKLFFTKE